MGISSIGSLTGIAELAESEELPRAPEAGWRHLSLPASMVLLPEWLHGWERFPLRRTVPEPAATESTSTLPLVEDMAKSPEQEIPFRLSGILSEESETVYCLFDKSLQRWIRLASGQIDPVSGIRIRGPVNDELIEDLKTGIKYCIDRDEYSLVPYQSDERLAGDQ